MLSRTRWTFTSRSLVGPVLARHLHVSTSLLRQALVDYHRVKDLSERSSTEASGTSPVLIDVREPDEYAAGSIPNAKNLPLSSLEGDLSLSAAEFEQKLGYRKPEREQELVFYCKAGVRSTNASNIAEGLGYGKIGNYKGSWLDWSAQSGTSSSAGAGAGAPGAISNTSNKAKANTSPNPNETSGHGEGADGGIDLKAMNRKEEARAQGRKDAEKRGEKKLESAEGTTESESVRSGAEMNDSGKFQ